MRRTVVCVVGTRPEAVKMAPVVLRLRREGSGIACRVVTTGQHRELLERALADFGLAPDRDLAVMRPGQGLAALTARALVALDRALEAERPDLVLAVGDTTTVLCAALACFYRRVPFGHVEAGLRTGAATPFPEEKNRALAGRLAELHFCPTAAARRNLLREGVAPAAIHLTGNTVIDALHLAARRDVPPPIAPATRRYLLVTSHRRENWGEPLAQVCAALRDLVERREDLSVVFPVHPNPRVREVVNRGLAGLERVHLIEPAGYPEFVALMKGAFLVLTDSGGVQEEAPALGKPVLVLREETERPEAVAAGTARVVGPHRGAIVAAVAELCDRPDAYARLARAVNPFGDGRAAERVARVVSRRLGLAHPDHYPDPSPYGGRYVAGSIGRGGAGPGGRSRSGDFTHPEPRAMPP
jgi:UDP-N-acetylglucosamine 2-epimerase (non-hydrolysing)